MYKGFCQSILFSQPFKRLQGQIQYYGFNKKLISLDRKYHKYQNFGIFGIFKGQLKNIDCSKQEKKSIQHSKVNKKINGPKRTRINPDVNVKSQQSRSVMITLFEYFTILKSYRLDPNNLDWQLKNIKNMFFKETITKANQSEEKILQASLIIYIIFEQYLHKLKVLVKLIRLSVHCHPLPLTRKVLSYHFSPLILLTL